MPGRAKRTPPAAPHFALVAPAEPAATNAPPRGAPGPAVEERGVLPRLGTAWTECMRMKWEPRDKLTRRLGADRAGCGVVCHGASIRVDGTMRLRVAELNQQRRAADDNLQVVCCEHQVARFFPDRPLRRVPRGLGDSPRSGRAPAGACQKKRGRGSDQPPGLESAPATGPCR